MSEIAQLNDFNNLNHDKWEKYSGKEKEKM